MNDAALVPCLGGCGQRVPRNLDQDHGICGKCWEFTFVSAKKGAAG